MKYKAWSLTSAWHDNFDKVCSNSCILVKPQTSEGAVVQEDHPNFGEIADLSFGQQIAAIE